MTVFNEIYFEALFHKFYDQVYSLFLKKTGSEDTAKDLAQLTFIKLWEYRERFSFELPELLQLNRKAKQVFIDWLRKEAHLRKLAEEIKATSTTETITKLELTDTIKKGLERLPPTRKKVFSMAYVEGFSHKEIASKLGISVKTVDAHVMNALKDLRKYLAFLTILGFISK